MMFILLTLGGLGVGPDSSTVVVVLELNKRRRYNMISLPFIYATVRNAHTVQIHSIEKT